MSSLIEIQQAANNLSSNDRAKLIAYLLKTPFSSRLAADDEKLNCREAEVDSGEVTRLDHDAFLVEVEGRQTRQIFESRLYNEWLPTYCHDSRRNYHVEGFDPISIQISEIDAFDFIRVIDQKILITNDGSRFRMPNSKAMEVIFWEHDKNVTPRKITLWLEPVITMASIARLHLDYGWPKEFLGMQSIDGAFDLTIQNPENVGRELIAGEVKSTSKELDKMLEVMHACCSLGVHEDCEQKRSLKNAHRKWKGLMRCQARYFLAIGPANDNRLFEISYENRIPVKMSAVSLENLRYKTNTISKEGISSNVNRHCMREPIPEIAEAAKMLMEAVELHLAGNTLLAESLIRSADIPAIRDWTESLWGRNSPHVQYRYVQGAPPSLPPHQRIEIRMPSLIEQQALLLRDGYHCRFCGIPVIRKEIRERIRKLYPNALSWGRTNMTQHAAFQAMWVQYDHILPHSRGGTSKFENTVITCAPCNYGRMQYTLDEVGLIDPFIRPPVVSSWNGLEQFI